jgi:hypothetical protein
MNKYLKFEYWNTCDLGNIYYQGGQHFWFYLDGDVLEPFHEDTEDGQENGEGDFIPTLRRQMKRYRIRTSLIPDYLIDAIQRMKLHDHIELTFKTGEVEQIYNLDIETEWQFEKYCWQGTVTMTFDMDEKVVLGACCDNLTVGAGVDEEGEPIPEPEPIPDLYWVAQTGSDVSGDGSYNNPWATFGYASTQATVSGDVIHMKAGTITETIQSSFTVGVSIVGAGATSIIHSHYHGTLFTFMSAVENTNGNQSISYLRFDGDAYTGHSAILVEGRGNVSIHHCEFADFQNSAVTFDGQLAGGAEPTVAYAANNRFYNNTITDCCGTFVGEHGSFILGGQKDLWYYNNNTYIPYRGAGNWTAIKFVSEGYCMGLKIFDSVFTTDVTNYWQATFELWNCRGGVEIYGNTIPGDVDFGGLTINDDHGGYGFAAKVHDNIFGTPNPVAAYAIGIDLEHNCTGGWYIYSNYFNNVPIPVHLSPDDGTTIEDVYIYYNIMNNVGRTGGTDSFGIAIQDSDKVAPILDNINVFNNVIIANQALTPAWGIYMDTTTSGITGTNIRILNNIIQGFNSACIRVQGDWDIVDLRNNIAYQNGNTDDVEHTFATITNFTESGHIKDNPDFVTPGSDFHLQAGSPCINAGIALGQAFITTDYDGDPIGAVPEIGAYKY